MENLINKINVNDLIGKELKVKNRNPLTIVVDLKDYIKIIIKIEKCQCKKSTLKLGTFI